MAANDSLDRKLVEFALEQHRESRRAFHRDLRIVCAILLAFQLLLFFRFVQLDDRRTILEAQLARIEGDRAALVEVQERLSGVGASLAPIHSHLALMPPALRDHLLVIDSFRVADCTPGLSCPPSDQSPIQIDVAAVTGTEMPESTPRPSPAELVASNPACPILGLGPAASPASLPPSRDVAQTPGSTSIFGSGGAWLQSYLDELPEDERALLQSGVPDDAYDALVGRIVDDVVVPALFNELNMVKTNVVLVDLPAARHNLCLSLQRHRDTLSRYGLPGPEETLRHIETIEADLLDYVIAPPKLERWWSSYSGKEATAGSTEARIQAFSGELGATDARLAAALDEVSALSRQVESEMAQVRADLAESEMQFRDATDAFDAVAAPMPGIPIELKVAVLYYPAMLAVLFGAFAARYALDRSRARQLLPLIGRLGVSHDALEAYLSDPTLLPSVRGSADVRLRALLVGAVLAPGALFIASVARILASEAFDEDRLWYIALYILSTIVMAAGYAVLFGPMPRLTSLARRFGLGSRRAPRSRDHTDLF